MRMLFVIDPISEMNVKKDTSLMFMLEAQARGHEVWTCMSHHLSAHGPQAYALATRVTVRHQVDDHVTMHDEVKHPLEAFDIIWMRRDPPFNMDYVYCTYILELADPAKTLVINRPSGLRAANEKMYLLNFPSAAPRTMVSRSSEEILAFVDACGGDAIIKPLDLMGGAGIFVLRSDDPNANSIVTTRTQGGEEFTMVQERLPGAKDGDKRLILMDGEPLGAVLRVPQGSEFRGNFAVGGQAVASEITARDREIIDAVVPKLRADGLWFVGLDIIDGYLTEVNVTSPTGVQEINRLDGTKIEVPIIDWAEANAPGGAGS